MSNLLEQNIPQPLLQTYTTQTTSTNTWRYWTSTTATANGTIAFATEIPDIHVSKLWQGNTATPQQPLASKHKVNGVAYAYANYYQFGRGLTQIGDYIPYVLFGNGTDVSNNVNLRPGDSLYLAGKYYHPGLIYVRFDGKSATGQSNVASQWGSSINVGSTTASGRRHIRHHRSCSNCL